MAIWTLSHYDICLSYSLSLLVFRLKKMAEGLNIGENGDVVMTRPGEADVVKGSERKQRVCNRKCTDENHRCREEAVMEEDGFMEQAIESTKELKGSGPGVSRGLPPPASSGASVIVFALAVVTLPRSRPQSRAFVAFAHLRSKDPLANQGGSCGSLPGPPRHRLE